MTEESELKELIKQVREQKAMTDANTEGLKHLKDKLRVFMVDSGVHEYDGVQCRRVLTFDMELLYLEHHDIFKQFCTRIEKHTHKNEWNDKKAKERFMNLHPDIYKDKDYLEEKTARLTGV